MYSTLNIITQKSKSRKVYMACSINCRMADCHSRSSVCWKALQIRFVMKLCSGWQGSMTQSVVQSICVSKCWQICRCYILKIFVIISLPNCLIYGMNFLDRCQANLISVPLSLTCVFLVLPHVTVSTHYARYLFGARSPCCSMTLWHAALSSKAGRM